MMVKIQSLQKKDAPQVALLIGQLTKNIVDRERLVARIKTLANQKNSRFLVALSGKRRVVGFGGLAWYHIPSKGRIGWVEEVVVDEKSRGQGIGRALLEKLLALAKTKKINQVKLTVSNPVAKKLYEDLGFAKKENEYLFKNIE